MTSLSHRDVVREGTEPAVPVLIRLPDLNRPRAGAARTESAGAGESSAAEAVTPADAETRTAEGSESVWTAVKARTLHAANLGLTFCTERPRGTAVAAVAAVALIGLSWSLTGSSNKPAGASPAETAVQKSLPVPKLPKADSPLLLSPTEPKQTFVSIPAATDRAPPSVVPERSLFPPTSVARMPSPGTQAAVEATSGGRRPGVARLTGKIVDRDNAPIEARHEPHRQGLY